MPSHIAIFDDVYALPQVRRHLDQVWYTVHSRFYHGLRVERVGRGESRAREGSGWTDLQLLRHELLLLRRT